MPGLLDGVLPYIFSQSNRLKRHVGGLLSDPAGSLAQTAGLLGDQRREMNELDAQAFADPSNRLRVTNRDALQRMTEKMMAGPMGFAPAGVVAPTFVRAAGTTATLPEDAMFANAVGNTPGAQIAEDGLLMRVQRSQRPEQGNQPSVRGGVFYLPEGAAQAKHYSTGKDGYGGSEKIAGETLIQNPLFVKGATGGKAPEAAYDQLAGKGAYQAMRKEVLDKVMGYGLSPAQKVARVDEFLDKYAPELAGQGGYILKNSAQGNQLAYALQEAAVASAARAKGHDAVLGYSMNRQKQPFLSELLDVREKNYPDKFGTFKTWD